METFNQKEIITNSAEETQKVGEEFANELYLGSLICLYGNLGSGKTTFVQGIATGLGITKRIISPTFVFIRRYEMARGKNARVTYFYHVDLYRIKHASLVENLGLMEVLSDENAIIAVEWPEKLGSNLGKKRWDIHLDYLGDDERKIYFSKVIL